MHVTTPRLYFQTLHVLGWSYTKKFPEIVTNMRFMVGNW